MTNNKTFNKILEESGEINEGTAMSFGKRGGEGFIIDWEDRNDLLIGRRSVTIATHSLARFFYFIL